MAVKMLAELEKQGHQIRPGRPARLLALDQRVDDQPHAERREYGADEVEPRRPRRA
jgi:hypothetical protein